MAHEFTYLRRVEFADTDTAEVAHFSAFFRFMEEAEHAFYRSLGSTAYAWEEDRVVGMPRVSAACDYRKPVRYGEEIEVRLTVRRKTAKLIGYEVVFRRRAGDGPDEVARGAMEVVYAVRPHGAKDWAAADLPSELADRIEVAPDS